MKPNPDFLTVGLFQNQRERILNAFLSALPVIGTIAYIIAIPSTVQNKEWLSAAIYTLGWLGLSGIALWRKRIPYGIKVGSILVFIYLIAVQSIPSYGFASGIQGWLLTLTVFSIIFLGNKGGHAASIIGATTMGAGGAWVILTRPVLPETGVIGTPIAWAISTGAYLAISIGVTIVLSNLLNALQTNLTEKEQLAKELNDKNLDLQGNAQLLQDYGRQLQKRASRFQAITEISQSIALTQNPADLMPLIARSISEKFGFYHTGVFLMDEAREYAVLQAANSEGGQKMLARGHRLKAGTTGIVGYAAQSGRPRIALDTGTDAVFFNNPDLPTTRSEVALPLKVGNNVIGVLDVQSEEPSAFNAEDVDTFNTLANQVAIVIQNARLLNQARSALEAYVQIGSRGWREYLENKAPGYSYLSDGALTAVQPGNEKQMQSLLASGGTVMFDSAATGGAPSLIVPVKLRDRVIGAIRIEAADASRKFSEDEIAIVQSISERAAFALENARLFEETSRRAEQERIVSQVTSRISESNNFERIMQTTIQELGRTLGTTRAFIQLETSLPTDKGAGHET